MTIPQYITDAYLYPTEGLEDYGLAGINNAYYVQGAYDDTAQS